MELKWDEKIFIKRMKMGLFLSFWLVIFILMLQAVLKEFPVHGSLGDMLYNLGKLSGLYGLVFLSFTISSRAFFSQLKRIMNPLKFHKAIMGLEITGITLILLHPLFLLAGRLALGFPNPFDIIIPKFSSTLYLFIAYGCIAFWMIFVAGILMINRNSIKINRYWRYFYMLIYPAFFFSLIHGFITGSSITVPLIAYSMILIYWIVVTSILYKIIEFMLQYRKRYLNKAKK